MIFSSFPTARLQTFPRTLGGNPCHHNSRTLLVLRLELKGKKKGESYFLKHSILKRDNSNLKVTPSIAAIYTDKMKESEKYNYEKQNKRNIKICCQFRNQKKITKYLIWGRPSSFERRYSLLKECRL